ncbi:MAG: hypothetical protein E7487_08800 [Ruminococcaceae bacterium]|nr:hypothetical protein [Oscillospiraceae bacterium]
MMILWRRRSRDSGELFEDGSQRSYFPTGFQFYVYGETLYDSSVSFEELKEDYFSHAFGENWKAVVEYLEKLRDLMDYSYFFGIRSIDKTKGSYYCPEMQTKANEARKVVEAFEPVIKANKNQDYRASAVAWQLLEIHCDLMKDFTEMVAHKCVGENEEAIQLIDKMIDSLSRTEIYIERYYDHYMFARGLERYAERKKKKGLLS